MNSPLIYRNVSKRYRGKAALEAIDLEIPAGRVVGLLGRNGAGKSTLLNMACGLILPTEGSCQTLGVESRDLDAPQFARFGMVFQENRFLDHLTVRRVIGFTAAFYPEWDEVREARLARELELPLDRPIVALSPGDQQKIALLLAVCHHPSLLLLDEPASALDPIVRRQVLDFLLRMVREDDCTIVVSSHVLADLEKIADWVVCVDQGQLAVSSALDGLQESYAEWVVTSPEPLPRFLPEAYVLGREDSGRQSRLRVRAGEEEARTFRERYGVELTSRPLGLEELFPLLIQERVAVR